MRELFLDIETIPSQDAAVRAEIDAKYAVSDVLPEIRAAANLKDPEKIAADIAARTERAKLDLDTHKQKAADNAEQEWRDTALNGGKGHAFSVAWAWGDDPVQSFNMSFPRVVADGGLPQDKIAALAHHLVLASETTMLGDFFAAINRNVDAQAVTDIDMLREMFGGTIDKPFEMPPLQPGSILPLEPGYDFIDANIPRVVAHRADFDIRFLWQRAVVLGLETPHWWPINIPAWKSWRVFDTMATWAGVGNRISLDKLCRALGVPGKGDGIDGSKVWDAVREGRSADVVDYNRDDVERLRSCFRKMTFTLPPVAAAVKAA